MKIGETIKKMRKAEGINLRDMSKRMNISVPTLSRIENGKEVTIKTYNKIHAYIFGW